VRKTVTALAATSLLFVAACADEREGTLLDPDRSTTTTTTTPTTEPGGPGGSTTTTEPGDPGDPSNPDDDPGNNEACAGHTPVWAFAPTSPSAPRKATPRAQPANYVPTSGSQEPSDDCDQPGPQLGTGDVQITLRWHSSADLDLHVTEPDGTEIWYADKGPTSTGGRLDVDSNVGCDEDGSVENVFWPTGRMPRGEFTVEINGYEVDGCGSGGYTVVAKVRGREVLNESGEVGEDESDPYHFDS
jgi:hypothetical protein